MTPDEIAARLVAADELLTKGDPRGELVSVQCELERGGFGRDRGIALRRREVELLQNAKAWSELEPWASDVVFRGGFVDEIQISVQDFVEHELEIWRRAPYLRHVRFTGFARYVDEVPVPPDPMPGLLERVFASGRLTGFEAMDAFTSYPGNNPMYQDDVSATSRTILAWLIANGRMPALRSFGMTNLWSQDVLALAAHLPPSIDRLSLNFELGASLTTTAARPTRLTLIDRAHPQDVRALLASPLGSEVRELELGPLVFDGAVLVTPTVRKLRGIVTTNDAADIAVVAASPALARVEELSLYIERYQEDPERLRPLFESKTLESLRVLRIVSGNTSRAVDRALFTSPLAMRLELIDLRTTLPEKAENVGWDGVLLA